MNLNPTTVAAALQIVGEKLGLDPERDRPEVIDYLNRIRSIWYHSSSRSRLFDDFLECVPIEKLCVVCPSGTCQCASYNGITLPLEMAGPVSAWSGADPMLLRSRWREKSVGRDSYGPGLSLIEIPGSFATTKDITGGETVLKIYASSKRDDGKQITIKGVDCNGKQLTSCIKLIGDGWVDTPVAYRQITRIILPACLTGEVKVVATNNDAELGRFSPKTPLIPEFRRFKILGPCDPCNSHAYIQANRRYRDVYFDEDTVEIGDRLVLEYGASYFKFGENTTDTKELQRAAMDLSAMNTLIKGLSARERGGHVQDGPVTRKSRRTRSARLPGYRGR